jgi:hypothetical protein
MPTVAHAATAGTRITAKSLQRVLPARCGIPPPSVMR